jgi:hypothetical protein
VVECDGFAAHGTREGFEEDRAWTAPSRWPSGASSESRGAAHGRRRSDRAAARRVASLTPGAGGPCLRRMGRRA